LLVETDDVDLDIGVSVWSEDTRKKMDREGLGRNLEVVVSEFLVRFFFGFSEDKGIDLGPAEKKSSSLKKNVVHSAGHDVEYAREDFSDLALGLCVGHLGVGRGVRGVPGDEEKFVGRPAVVPERRSQKERNNPTW